MISFTVTTQKTQGQYRSRFQGSNGYTVIDVFGGSGILSESPIYQSFWIDTRANATTAEVFWSSDGGYSASESITASGTGSSPGEDPEFSYSGSDTYSYSFTRDSNGAETVKGATGGTFYYNENDDIDYFSDTFTTEKTLTPTTTRGVTTTDSTLERGLDTSIATKSAIAVGTTVNSGSEKVASTTFSLVDTTVGTFTNLPTNVTTTTTQEIATALVTREGGIEEPPRDTATVFCAFANECVWVPTRTDSPHNGPWALTDFASSHTTDFTALPAYSTSPLVVIDANENTFPEPNLDSRTETRASFSRGEPESIDIWRLGFPFGFPLTKDQGFTRKLVNDKATEAYPSSQPNNPLLTFAATEIGRDFSNYVKVKNEGLEYDQVFEFTFTTTKYLGTWSATYSTQYAGPFTRDDGNGNIESFPELEINFSNAVTIEGTNVEQIKIRAFSPCAISHVESSFLYAWGLHGNDGPEPLARITVGADLKIFAADRAELLPRVSVPFPTTYSWKDGANTHRASLVGNAVTVVTVEDSTSQSQSYRFGGDGEPLTQQLVGQDFFTNSTALPGLTFFGPHPATESIELRAAPGEYVSVTQNSEGDFTLQTITKTTSWASTLSQNAVLFRGEKSFYTSNFGGAFVVTPRNVIP